MLLPSLLVRLRTFPLQDRPMLRASRELRRVAFRAAAAATAPTAGAAPAAASRAVFARSMSLYFNPAPVHSDADAVVAKLKHMRKTQPVDHSIPAQDLIAKVPVIEVDADTAICDGGDGALGHPREFIQLNKTKHTPETCKYCGLRFIKKEHH